MKIVFFLVRSFLIGLIVLASNVQPNVPGFWWMLAAIVAYTIAVELDDF